MLRISLLFTLALFASAAVPARAERVPPALNVLALRSSDLPSGFHLADDGYTTNRMIGGSPRGAAWYAQHGRVVGFDEDFARRDPHIYWIEVSVARYRTAFQARLMQSVYLYREAESWRGFKSFRILSASSTLFLTQTDCGCGGIPNTRLMAASFQGPYSFSVALHARLHTVNTASMKRLVAHLMAVFRHRLQKG